MPLLHLQWTAIVDIHLVVLGGIPRWTTIITPQGVLTEARIRVLLIGIHRFVMATALLLLFWGGQVPSCFLNPQECKGVAREGLNVPKLELGPSLLCPSFIILEGLLWSLNGGPCVTDRFSFPFLFLFLI